MIFHTEIHNEKDRTRVQMQPEGESWGCGSYLTKMPIKKAQRDHPLRLLFLVLWCAAEMDAILREKALPQPA